LERIRRELRKRFEELKSRSSVKKELCLEIVDALDEPKHLLSDAYTLYEVGFRERAIGLVSMAPRKARDIRARALARGAPNVVAEEDMEYIEKSFREVENKMKKGVPPENLEKIVYNIDGELYERMLQKFHQCQIRGRV